LKQDGKAGNNALMIIYGTQQKLRERDREKEKKRKKYPRLSMSKANENISTY